MASWLSRHRRAGVPDTNARSHINAPVSAPHVTAWTQTGINTWQVAGQWLKLLTVAGQCDDRERFQPRRWAVVRRVVSLTRLTRATVNVDYQAP
jgi:hypothetical protein